MMANLPSLTESDVRQRVGSTSFERGAAYFRQGAIRYPQQAGATLKARCEGSAPDLYRLEVTFDDDSIARAHCTCPVGDGGFCKHIAALLLTWIHQPEVFAEAQAFEDALEQRSKAELIAMLRRVITHHPEVENLLSLPLPSAQGSEAEVDPETIRDRVRDLFGNQGYDAHYGWGGYGASVDFYPLLSIGQEYADQENWYHAATVYRTLLDEALHHYNPEFDHEGDTIYSLHQAAEALGPCLDHLDDAILREGILRVLFDLYSWDLDQGGYGMGDPVPGLIDTHATPEERQRIAGWVRNKLQRIASDSWASKAYGGLLLDLERDTLDDEAFLRICRKSGRTEDLIDRLLSLDRLDEAIAAAQATTDQELLHLAPLFAGHDQTEAVATLVRARDVGDDASWQVLTWLRDHAAAQQDAEQALRLSERLFWMRPSVDRYEHLRTHARAQGRWDSYRATLLDRLRNEDRYALLTDIHLADDEVGEALKMLPKVTSTNMY